VTSPNHDIILFVLRLITSAACFFVLSYCFIFSGPVFVTEYICYPVAMAFEHYCFFLFLVLFLFFVVQTSKMSYVFTIIIIIMLCYRSVITFTLFKIISNARRTWRLTCQHVIMWTAITTNAITYNHHYLYTTVSQTRPYVFRPSSFFLCTFPLLTSLPLSLLSLKHARAIIIYSLAFLPLSKTLSYTHLLIYLL